MMCHTMGRLPMGSIGFGSSSLASRMRVPRPPQRMTAFTGRRSVMQFLDGRCAAPGNELADREADHVCAGAAQLILGTETPGHADAAHAAGPRGRDVVLAIADHHRVR